MEELIIPDGRKEFYLFGDTSRVIRINLNDDNILQRFKETYEEVMGLVDEMSAHTADEDYFDISKKLDDEIKKKLNYIFDYDVSSAVFGNVSLLAVVNHKTGDTFLEAFLNAIMPKIEAERKHFHELSKKRMREIKTNTNKYTRKYEGDENGNEPPEETGD